MSDPNQFQPPPPPTIAAPPPPRRPPNMMMIGIGLCVLGVLIAITGMIKILPGGVGLGVVSILGGLLVIGLSFIPLPEPAPNAPAPLSVVNRIMGMFYEPTNVFQNLRSHPHWLAALLIICATNILYLNVFTHRLRADHIIEVVTDKMKESPIIPPETVERSKADQLELAHSIPLRVGAALKSVVGTMFFTAVVAVIYLLCVLVFGGRMNYWQSFAVSVHAFLPFVVIQKLLSMVVLFIKEPDSINAILGQESLVTDNLGGLIVAKDHPMLFVLATAIGVLALYRLWLLATGLRHGGTRVSASAAWGVALGLWLIRLLFFLGLTALFPSFVS